MKLLCLRGSVPSANEHPEKLLYDHIDNCEDMWTQLWYYMCNYLKAHGELWYDNSATHKTIKIEEGIYERWTSNFKLLDYSPDIIFARGGFPSYVPVLKRYPNAIKIYYGAGRRYMPQDDIKYDLVLADSPKQLKHLRERGYNSSLFIKPAAFLFNYFPTIEKIFDILFVGNGSHSHLKGHKFMINTFAGTNHRILNIGNINKQIVNYATEKKTNVTWAGWHLRKYLPTLMNSCRTALVCTTDVDSCPRVIPEALACGLPLIVTNNVHFWKEKYINNTGYIVKKKRQDVLEAVFNCKGFDHSAIRKYYEQTLGFASAVRSIFTDEFSYKIVAKQIVAKQIQFDVDKDLVERLNREGL